MMKTFLLLIISSVVAAGVLPSLPAKIVLSALVLTAALTRRPAMPQSALKMREGFALFASGGE